MILADNPDASNGVHLSAQLGVDIVHMEKVISACFAVLVVAGSAAAEDVSSEYTRFDRERDCSIVEKSRDEGDWADFVCPGYRGYPVVIRYTDGRETVTYGFATKAGMPSITPFNEAAETIEWRLRRDGPTAYPFAAIQRWQISHDEGKDDAISQILVISKVGQPKDAAACAVAFIPATGNVAANQRAREIADESVPAFKCGTDKVEIDPALRGMVAAPQ